MSDYTITIPDRLYEKAQHVARQSLQNVDDVLHNWLEAASVEPSFNLAEDERDELKAMAYLSDDTLWTIAREQMKKTLQERMSILMSKNTSGEITAAEYEELAELVERGNRLTLRKAQAVKYLKERGHSIQETIKFS